MCQPHTWTYRTSSSTTEAAPCVFGGGEHGADGCHPFTVGVLDSLVCRFILCGVFIIACLASNTCATQTPHTSSSSESGGTGVILSGTRNLVTFLAAAFGAGRAPKAKGAAAVLGGWGDGGACWKKSAGKLLGCFVLGSAVSGVDVSRDVSEPYPASKSMVLRVVLAEIVGGC